MSVGLTPFAEMPVPCPDGDSLCKVLFNGERHLSLLQVLCVFVRMIYGVNAGKFKAAESNPPLDQGHSAKSVFVVS